MVGIVYDLSTDDQSADVVKGVLFLDRLAKRINLVNLSSQMKKALLIWFISSVLAFTWIEIETRGSHYQGAGYIIMVMYSLPILLIILIVGLVKKLRKKSDNQSKSPGSI